MNQIAVSADAAERRRLFEDVQRIYADEMPVISFAAPKSMMAISSRVVNPRPAPQIPQLLWSADTLAARPQGSRATPNSPPSSVDFSTTGVDTPAGRLTVGLTWDEALPMLNTGTRLDFGFETPDRAVERRRFDLTTYKLTYERTTGGPLRLVRIEKQ